MFGPMVKTAACNVILEYLVQVLTIPLPILRPANAHPANAQQVILKYLRPCNPPGRPRLRCRLLASVWHSPSHCHHLGSDRVDSILFPSSTLLSTLSPVPSTLSLCLLKRMKQFFKLTYIKALSSLFTDMLSYHLCLLESPLAPQPQNLPLQKD